MASYLELYRCNLIPLSPASLCACQSRPFSKTLVFSRHSAKLKLRFIFDRSRGSVRTHRLDRRSGFEASGRVFLDVSGAEPDGFEEEEMKEEIERGYSSLKIERLVTEQQGNQLKKRIIFGLGIGICVGGIVLTGGWFFTVALASAVLVGAREYFELVRSRGIASGMTPPPRYVSRVCSIICALMPILTMFGHMGVSVTSSAFIIAMALILQRENPRFAQLSSAMFGLFYCGYLPCFWVKLRCGLAAPALNTKIGATWPILLGGQAHWTVGLVATLISVSGIIAADTFAFLGGKAFGRTPLTNISPKKTLEGAFAGLCGCVASTLILSKILSWPTSLLRLIHPPLICYCRIFM
ncbi:phosphatidate cytidylyltransferase 5, chloroplastic-like isoform X2 [Tasmannia lanceolata]|uniref:phosphatidate cytidylyltransferase 5, chloroplastic-like isoform X2 n=1 Tax=Tasmannia lanceolata TaxID=3420 RepID=UPI004062D039